MRSRARAISDSKKDATVNTNGVMVNKFTHEPLNMYSNVMADALAKIGKTPSKEFTKRTSDAEKLEKQREKFLGTCRYCKQPMVWVKGSNVLACTNPDCDGYVKKDDEGKVVDKIPCTRLLSGLGADIAETLFA